MVNPANEFNVGVTRLGCETAEVLCKLDDRGVDLRAPFFEGRLSGLFGCELTITSLQTVDKVRPRTERKTFRRIVDVVANEVESSPFEVHKGEGDPVVVGGDVLNAEPETHLLQPLFEGDVRAFVAFELRWL